MAAELFADGDATFSILGVLTQAKGGGERTTSTGIRKVTIILEVKDCTGHVGTIWQDVGWHMGWMFKAIGDAIGRDIDFDDEHFKWKGLKGLGGHCIMARRTHEKYGTQSIIKKYLPKINGNHTPSDIIPR